MPLFRKEPLCSLFKQGFFHVREERVFHMNHILIIDEQSSFREGLKGIIEYHFGPEVKIVGMDNAQLPLSTSFHPQLVITDCIEDERTRDILMDYKNKGTKIILLIQNSKKPLDTSNIGFLDGFLMKKMPTKQLLLAIKRVFETDEVYVHPEIGYQFFKKLVEKQQKHLQTV